MRGLPIDPFHDSPDPALYVPRDATEQALEALLDGAGTPGRPVALVAPPGAGKTLLLHVLATRLPAPLRSVYVPHPGLSPDDLCAWTLGQLGSPRWPDPTPVVRAYASHRAACGGALVWLIDDADRLPDRTGRWLADATAEAGIRLVLAADDASRAPWSAFPGLRRVDALARPLSSDEVGRYVRGRLERAGVEASRRRRCEDSIERIAAASAGIPRAVNAICDRLLSER